MFLIFTFFYNFDMLSEKLIALRKKKRLSQETIAKNLGISRVQYGRYENGSSEISIEYIKKIAKFYDVSIDYLLEYSTSKLDVDFLKARIKELDIEQKEELLIKILEAIIDECK